MESTREEDRGGTGESDGAAETRFERARRTTGLLLGPLLMVYLLLQPPPGLSPQAQHLVAILALVVTYWVTEPIPIPVTALLGAILCVIFKVSTAQKVFAPFADPTIFLFLGSFILARAMMVHNLHRRVAFGILSLRWVGDSSARILFAFGAIAAFTSMWISNTATTAMMFPVGLGLAQAVAGLLERKSGKPVDAARLRFGTGIMLMAAYAASAGGIGTPVGTPPNLVGMAMIEKLVQTDNNAPVKIPFFQWMLFAVPILAALYVVLFVVLYLLHRPELSRIEGGREYVRGELDKLGPWTPGQRNTVAAFVVTVALWVTPGFLSVVFGTGSRIYGEYGARLPEGIAALIGAVLLFVLPVDWRRREFTLKWHDAVKIDWGTLILFGAGLSLGSLMFESGFAETLGKGLLDATGIRSLWGMTLGAIVISVLVSETTSNTAAANVVVPVVISFSAAAGIPAVPPALGATLGASWGLMLPVATPPNAIVYASGMIPITKMIQAGFLFDLAGIVLIWAGLRVLLPMLGLA